VLRLYMRWRNGVPAPEKSIPALLKWVAHLTHFTLYTLLIVMPLTGALAWFWKMETSALLHESLRFLLVIVLAGHAFGALFEHLVMRNDTLRRMIPWLHRPAA
jgi:cytochrome b561